MKTFSLITLVATAALLTSCNKEISMETTIHADGSCQREIWFHADSASLVNPEEGAGTFIIDVLNNDAWDKIWEYSLNDTVNGLYGSQSGQYPMTEDQFNKINASWKSQYTSVDTSSAGTSVRLIEKHLKVHATRQFDSVEEMASKLPLSIKNERIKSTAKLERSFHWFYTEYTFSETFQSIAPYFEIPLSRFMSDDEASYWMTGTPNILSGMSGFKAKSELDDLEIAFFKYINCNAVHDLFKIIIDNYDSIYKAPLPLEEFVKISQIIEEDDKSLVFNPLSQERLINEEMLNTRFLEMTGGKTDCNAYLTALKEHPSISNLWEIRYGDYSYLIVFDVCYGLSMPGDIIDLNRCGNATYRDGKLLYSLTGMSLLTPGYTIQATSRDRNLWSFAISILIGIVAIILCTKKGIK